MRRLALAEHGAERGVRLTRAEREALQAAVPEVTVSPSRGVNAGPGRFDVTPGSWVGVAQVTPTLVVEIAPKLAVSRVLFLLSYARDARACRLGETTRLEGRADLVETVVGLFCAEVRRTLRFGRLHGYRRREEAVQTVRGRLRVEEQVRRRFGQAVPAECAFDEVTADIPENRLLKAALGRAARLGGTAARQARALLAAFGDVGDLSVPDAVPVIERTRLNERLLPALGLARLILGGAGLEARAGQIEAPSILFDMDRVFEDFVVVALREVLGLSEWAFPQGGRGRKRLSLDRAGTLPLEPDLSWWEAGRCVFVGDVKYKRTVRGEQGDLYQLLAYATASDLPGGLLVYAAGDGNDESTRVHLVRHGGRALHMAALDLGAPPAQVLAQVARVAKVARRLKSAAGRSVA